LTQASDDGSRGDLALALLAGLFAQAVTALTALTPPVFAVVAAVDFGVDAATIGVFTALLYLSAMLSAVVIGGWVRRLGPIRVSQLCLTLNGVGIALIASGSLALAGLGALIIGIGYGPMTPASSYMLGPVTAPRWRPFVFSLKQTSVPLGGMAAGLIIPWITETSGWQAAALAVAALSLAVVLGLQPLRQRFDGRRERGPLRLRIQIVAPVRAVLAQGALRSLAVTSMIYASMQLCLGTFLVVFMVSRAGLTLIEAGGVLAAAQIAGLAGRIGWGALAEHWISTAKLLALLGVGMALGATLLAQTSPGWDYGVCLLVGAIFGVSAIGWNGIYLSEIVRVSSLEEAARATGGVLFFTFGGMMLGPAAFKLILVLGGDYSLAYALIAGVTLIPVWLLTRGR
jgi:MFS family permease